MPNFFASLAVMYVSLSSAAFTSPSPLPLCACMIAERVSRVCSAFFALMMISVVCPLTTWCGW